MNSINKTLYIPLYGKALVSRKGVILQDPKAEEIWGAEGFPLKGKAASKWLAYYMGMRSAVFDRWLARKMSELPDAAVLHLGCGLDSRILRVGSRGHNWFDVDFPEVIDQRKQYYPETDHYQMVGSDVQDLAFLSGIPWGRAIVVMEGISIYLSKEALTRLLTGLAAHFSEVHLLMDCYSETAAKLSKYKNPINQVGVTQVYGLDDPHSISAEGLSFLQAHDMTPEDLIAQLTRPEQMLFRKLYAGNFAGRLYRLYEFG